jgi:copper(I)-binding protein
MHNASDTSKHATGKSRMKINLLFPIAMLATCAFLTPSVHAQSAAADNIVISQPWSRATPGGAKVAAGYMTIENKGTTSERLIGGSTDAAAKIEVHEMATTNGVMTMRQMEGGLTIGPGATVKLAPGGYHLMMMEIAHPLKQGDKVAVTLNFERAGKKQVTLGVLGVGAKGPADSSAAPSMDHGNMNMDHSKMKM